jgi:hypothetical protein
MFVDLQMEQSHPSRGTPPDDPQPSTVIFSFPVPIVIASDQRERGNLANLLAVLLGWIASSAMPPRNDKRKISTWGFSLIK